MDKRISYGEIKCCSAVKRAWLALNIDITSLSCENCWCISLYSIRRSLIRQESNPLATSVLFKRMKQVNIRLNLWDDFWGWYFKKVTRNEQMKERGKDFKKKVRMWMEYDSKRTPFKAKLNITPLFHLLASQDVMLHALQALGLG